MVDAGHPVYVPVPAVEEGTTQATWGSAMFRALINAVISFGGTTLATYLSLASLSFTVNGASVGVPRGDRWETALITGGVAFFTALGWRGLAEGSYDAKRQAEGKHKTSDVTPNPPAVVVDAPPDA